MAATNVLHEARFAWARGRPFPLSLPASLPSRLKPDGEAYRRPASARNEALIDRFDVKVTSEFLVDAFQDVFHELTRRIGRSEVQQISLGNVHVRKKLLQETLNRSLEADEHLRWDVDYPMRIRHAARSLV